VNDDELLRGVGAAARRLDGELAQLESAPADDLAVERAVSELRRGVAASSSGVVERSRARRARFLAAGATAAAAAAAVWVVGVRQPAQLPDYTIAVLAGGAEPERALGASGPATTIRVRPGGTLEVVARPATRVAVPIDARAYVIHDDEVSPWDAEIEITPEGAARIHGAIDAQAPLSSGAWSLAVVVAPRGSLPSDPAQLADHARAADVKAPYKVVRVTLVAQPTP
jgi:hypothetical protein